MQNDDNVKIITILDSYIRRYRRFQKWNTLYKLYGKSLPDL